MKFIHGQNDNTIQEREEELTFVEKALEEIRIQQSSLSSNINLRFLVPSCNHCKRFFLVVRKVSIDCQKPMTPLNFVYLMFMYYYRDSWSLLEVTAIVH